MTTIAAAAAGAWLWDKFGEKIVVHAGKVGSYTGHHLWGKVSWKAAAERYRGEMQRLYSMMRIIGMAEPVALADIFTDVYLLDKPSAWRRYNIDELQQQIQTEESETSRSQRNDALIIVQRYERLVILGKPGAGKTTLLKHLVLQCTTGKLDAVPIFVGLKAWADSELALMAFLTQQFAICAFPDAQPFIEAILEEGHALVLFDGLDEVNLEQGTRERITRELSNLTNRYPRSKCVITCRTAAIDYQFEYFVYCELADFTEGQMRTFVTHWFQHDESKYKAFLIEFARVVHNRLRDLARTPLLLTLLCLAFDETMSFPPRRAELYEEALDALLKKWDSSRSIKRDTLYRTLSLGHKRQMLARIAAETFADNKLFIRRDELTQKILTFVQRLPSIDPGQEFDGEAILREMEAQHGLLVERAYGIYSFSHLTFHEYFVARYIAEHPSRQMFDSILAHAEDPQWREVLLLTASMLDDTNTATFFEVFDETLRSMLQDEPGLFPLLQWMQRKAHPTLQAQQVAVRQSYLVQALITMAIDSLLAFFEGTLEADLAPDRFRALARLQELVCDFAYNNNLACNIARDIASDLSLALDHALIVAINRAIDLDYTIEPTKKLEHATLIRIANDHVWVGFAGLLRVIINNKRSDIVGGTYDVPFDIEHQRINDDYDDALNIWHQQTHDDDYNMLLKLWNSQTSGGTHILHDRSTIAEFPPMNALFSDWEQFENNLREILVTNQDVGHLWTLDRVTLEHLADYLAAATRLLECLDLAAVADRDAIRNRLLLPPQP